MSEKPKRIQRSRKKGWRMPEGAVYVGRPTKWGNPHKVGYGVYQALSPAIAVRRYRMYLRGFGTPILEEIRAELQGKDLMCWCPLDQPCHADVLLEIANAVQTDHREVSR